MTDPSQSTSSVFLFISFFTLAVFISSFHFIPPLVGLFIIFLAIAGALGEKIYRREVSREVFLMFLIFLSFGLGVLRYDVKDFHVSSEFFSSGVGQLLEFQGVVVTEPEKRSLNTRFVVLSLGERILVSTDLYSDVRYGDEVRVKGKLRSPEKIEGEDGRSFNYPEYLAKDDIYYVTSFAKVEKLSGGHGYWLKRNLFSLKHSLLDNMRRILPEPESSLLAGLLISGKDALPESILEEFRRAGIVHIVVLSGYNITIIADFLRKASSLVFMRLRALGKLGALALRGPQVASGFSILGILAFILMTGAEATVVRAGIMVLVVISAKLFRRSYHATRALVAAAFLMILHNPKILVFDTSFQLSFLATLALIHVSPVVDKFLWRLPNKIGERTMLATTIATQIVVLPYLVYVMGDLSLVSLLANVLVLLVIPITMLLGFLASLVTYVSTVLAYPLSYMTHLFLSWVLGVSQVLGGFQYGAVSVSRFSFGWVVFAYLLLFILWKRLKSYFPRSAS